MFYAINIMLKVLVRVHEIEIKENPHGTHIQQLKCHVKVFIKYNLLVSFEMNMNFLQFCQKMSNYRIFRNFCPKKCPLRKKCTDL